MNNKLILLFLLLFIVPLFLSACSHAADPVDVPFPALHVENGKLLYSDGKPAVLRGMSSHGLGWYPRYISAGAMDYIKAHGGNVIRLALYTEASAGYLNEPYTLDFLYLGIENAIAQDMYVIVDWHILKDGNPMKHLKDAVSFFDEISAHYGDTPNIIYEICNEPNGDTNWADISEYAGHIIPTIRNNAPSALIIVGTPQNSSALYMAMNEPLPYENLMYSYHCYIDVAPDADNKSYYWMDKALEQSFPFFITEWGIVYEDFTNGPISTDILEDQYSNLNMTNAHKFANYINTNNISWCGWALSNSEEIHAAFHWDCDKLSAWDDSDLTPNGKLMFSAMDGKVMK